MSNFGDPPKFKCPVQGDLLAKYTKVVQQKAASSLFTPLHETYSRVVPSTTFGQSSSSNFRVPLASTGIIHSTPLPAQPSTKRSVLGPSVSSSNFDFSWSRVELPSLTGAGSCTRSITGSEAPSVCDRVMVTAFKKYLQRNPTTDPSLALTVLNGIRRYIEEAAEEVGEVIGKSHYSRYASSVRSFRNDLDESTKALLSIMRSESRIPDLIQEDATTSFVCHGKRLNLKNPSVNNNIAISMDVLTRRHSSPRQIDSAESGQGSNNLCATVLLKNQTPNKVMEIDEDEEKVVMKRRESRYIAAVTLESPVTKPTAKRKRTKDIKRPAKEESVEVLPQATHTSRGRNVRKTSFYQADRVPVKDAVSKKVTRRPVSKRPPPPTAIREPRKKPRVNIESTVQNSPVVITRTQRGRAVKIRNLEVNIGGTALTKSPDEKENSAPKRVAPQKNQNLAGKPLKKIKVIESDKKTQKKADMSDMSLDDLDFYIPEVSQTKRRAGRTKGLDKIGAQTPPLAYLTANLKDHITSSVTPAGKTPEWLSQRTRSEVKQLQKRKMPLNKKKSKK